MKPARDNAPSPDLKLSALLLAAAIAAALIFAAAFGKAPEMRLPAYLTDSVCGSPAQDKPAEDQSAKDPAADHDHRQAEGQPADDDTQASDAPAQDQQGAAYFGGGLWSERLGLSPISELAAACAVPDGRVVAHSVSWQNDKLVVLDVSPISADADDADQAPALAVVSVDHRGPDPSPEFGKAIQEHIQTLATPQKIVVLPPLPGDDKRPDTEFPYDWTYLMVNDKVDVVDWTLIEPMADLPGKDGSGYVRAWIGEPGDAVAGLSTRPVSELLSDLDALADPAAKAQVYFELIERGPYETVPAVRGWLNEGSAAPAQSPAAARDLAQALLIMRLLDVHADELIDRARESDSAALRRAAARAIGDLADQTHDPIGKLTRLAEDKDMAVRREALSACYQIGGRAAAGVAQLVEAYEMSDALLATYQAIMPKLLAYGEPIQPDSRANRLRRMPIDELLAEDRDTLVCKVLLERTDLPDNQIMPVIEKLGNTTQSEPLTALLDVLVTMNPQRLRERGPLLETLAAWDRAQLREAAQRLAQIATGEGIAPLRSAAAGGLIRGLPGHLEVIEAVGVRPVVFHGLDWVSPGELSEGWAGFVTETALSSDPAAQASRIAALDAIQRLPADAVKRATVDAVLALARAADDVPLRFAAIRAVNALPESLKPDDIDDLALTRLTIRAVPGQLRYDTDSLTVTAGRPVEITLVNPDTMPHNLVITTPGSATPIGMQVTAMPPNQAAAIDYVPESADVLHHTAMVQAGRSDTLRFVAPAKPGQYDYVCTFPGHYTTMRGVLEVVAP